MAGPSQRDLAERIELAQQSSADWQARHDAHDAQCDLSSSSEDEQRDSTLPMYRSRSHSLINAREALYKEPEPPLPSRPAQSPNQAFPSSPLPQGARAAARHPHGFEELPSEPRVVADDFAQREPEAALRSGRTRQDTATTSSSKSRKVDWKDVHTDAKMNARTDSDGGSMPPLSRQNSEFDVDDDNAFDDYAWDDDDDLLRQLNEKYEKEYEAHQADVDPRARRKAVIRKFSPIHLGKLLFTTFLGNVILVLALITPALCLHIFVRKGSQSTYVVFVIDNVEAWCYWIAFNFIARWAIHTAFELIPRLAILLIDVVWGGTSEKFRSRVELFNASKDYAKPLFFAGFFWGSFAVTFNTIFQLRDASDPENSSRAPYTYRLYQVVELLFFFAIVFGIEKLIIRFIGLRFHAVAYADRLRENMFALSTIDKLKDHRPKKKRPPVSGSYSHGANGGRSGATTPLGWRSPLLSVVPTPTMPTVALDGYKPIYLPHSRPSIPSVVPSQADSHTRSPLTSAALLSAGGSRPSTPIPLQRPGFADSVTSGSSRSKKKLATAQEIARQAMIDPLKTLQNPLLAKKGLGLDFSSPADGKRLARDLFHAFRKDFTRSYLVTSDFYPAFPTTEDAEAAFRVFDKDGNGDISRSEIKHTILAAYKERRFLARSLQDVSSAISTLDKVFMAVAFLVLALIAFAIFGINIYSNLTTAYTLTIALSFIFKSAASNLFDSIVFLFATHPFDTGDRIVVDQDILTVKKLGLFSTLFTRVDGTETMVANSKLGSVMITNYRRSAPQYENASLEVGWKTSLEQLDALEEKMNEWLQKDERRMFSPSCSIVISSFEYMRKININIPMGHRQNWQDWGLRWTNRTAFQAALLYFTKELGITYSYSAQPVSYWQDDLEQPPISDAGSEMDEVKSPSSPLPLDGEIDANQPTVPESGQIQPLLGFLPPEGSKMRRRRGQSHKRNMQGIS